jgi:hypothetical protein
MMKTRIQGNIKADERNVWDKKMEIFGKKIHMGHWRTIMKTRFSAYGLRGVKWLYLWC